MIDDDNKVVTLKVRVSPEFREKLVSTAKDNNRSMNAEIVDRLEKSFEEKQTHETEMHLMALAYKELKESSLSTQKQLETIIKTQNESLSAITTLLKQRK